MPAKTGKLARNRRPGANGNHPPVKHQFKPGQSGNPQGRPPGKSLTLLLRKKLEADDGKDAEAILDTLVRLAKGGSIRAIREILDRAEGKPTQAVNAAVEVTGPPPMTDEDRAIAARVMSSRLRRACSKD